MPDVRPKGSYERPSIFLKDLRSMRLDCEEVYLKLKIYGRLCQPGLRVLAPVTRKGTPDLHEGGHIGQLEIRYTRIAHYLFGLHLVGNVTLKSHLIAYKTVCTWKALFHR